MRLLLSVDMEGVADITHAVQTRRDNAEFARSCELMTNETIAACEGAASAGATDIVVNDAHGDMRNIEHERLPPAVRLIRGSIKPLSMVQGADLGIDAAAFIGYHAAANSINGILDHTYAGAQAHEVWLNGEPCSEARINAAVLGHWNVPLVFLSGDQTACADVQRVMPWVHTAVVKEALGRTTAMSSSPAVARDLIRTGIAGALASLGAGEMRPYRPDPPFTLRIRLMNSEKADVACVMPGVVRIEGTVVEYVAPDILTIFGALQSIVRLASTT